VSTDTPNAFVPKPYARGALRRKIATCVCLRRCNRPWRLLRQRFRAAVRSTSAQNCKTAKCGGVTIRRRLAAAVEQRWRPLIQMGYASWVWHSSHLATGIHWPIRGKTQLTCGGESVGAATGSRDSSSGSTDDHVSSLTRPAVGGHGSCWLKNTSGSTCAEGSLSCCFGLMTLSSTQNGSGGLCRPAHSRSAWTPTRLREALWTAVESHGA